MLIILYLLRSVDIAIFVIVFQNISLERQYFILFLISNSAFQKITPSFIFRWRHKLSSQHNSHHHSHRHHCSSYSYWNYMCGLHFTVRKYFFCVAKVCLSAWANARERERKCVRVCEWIALDISWHDLVLYMHVDGITKQIWTRRGRTVLCWQDKKAQTSWISRVKAWKYKSSQRNQSTPIHYQHQKRDIQRNINFVTFVKNIFLKPTIPSYPIM